MKRIFSVCLIFSLLCCLVFGTSFSASAVIKDFDYDVLYDGTISISINSQERHLIVPSEIDGYTVSSVRYVGAITDLWSVKITAQVKLSGE